MAYSKEELNEFALELEQTNPRLYAYLERRRRITLRVFTLLSLGFFLVCFLGFYNIRENQHLIVKQREFSHRAVTLRNFNIKYVCEQINTRVIIPDQQTIRRNFAQTESFLRLLGFTPKQIARFKIRARKAVDAQLKRRKILPCGHLPIKPKLKKKG